MSRDIEDITRDLAKRYGGLDLEQKKAAPPAPRQAPREYSSGCTTPSSPPPAPQGARIGSMDRILLGSNRSAPVPKRPPISIMAYTDQELEDMLNTPAKKSWDFSVWLEVIGLPPDLHEKHDASIYGFAARNFLARKREAHHR